MIFISYSHCDESLKDRVVGHLQALTDSKGVFVWDDRQISPGQEWLEEIKAALARAEAAVLLISVDFLNSRFIRDAEVPELLSRRVREGIRIFPILASPCSWKNYEWLSKIQTWPRDGRALSGMKDHELNESLVMLVAEIGRQLRMFPQSSLKSARDTQDAKGTEQQLLSQIDRELVTTSAQIGAASCALIVVDPDAGGRYLQIRCAHGPGSEKITGLRLPSNQGIAGLVFTHKILHLTNKLRTEPSFAPSVARKATLLPDSMVTVPIIVRNDVLGVGQFINKIGGPFLSEDTRIAQQFAETVAPLLDRFVHLPVDDRTFEGIRECSVIFTDITNYGQVANESELPITSKFLNEYLTLVCDVGLEFGFWIDKFLGDGVMLVGNAPRQRSEYAMDSVRVAMEIEKRMRTLKEEWIRYRLDAPLSSLQSRIGIATGRVYLGNFGHPKVHWYTAIGPPVNLAWRLLELGSRTEDCIMVCPRTNELVRDSVRADRVKVDYSDASTEPGFAYRIREVLEV